MPLSKPFEIGDRVLLSPLMYPSIDFPVILLGTEQGCLKIGAGIHGILIVGPEYVIHAPPPPDANTNANAKKKALSNALSISGFTPEQEERRYRARRDANLRGSVERVDHPLDTCQCGDYYKNHGRGTDPPHYFTPMEKHLPAGEYTIPSAAFSFKEGKDGQIKTVIDYSKAVPHPEVGDFVEVPARPVGSDIWERRKVVHIGRATFRVEGLDTLLCLVNHGRTWRHLSAQLKSSSNTDGSDVTLLARTNSISKHRIVKGFLKPQQHDVVEVLTEHGWKESRVIYVSEFDFDAIRAGDVPRFYRIQDYGKELPSVGWRFPSTPPKKP